jgi:HD-GYP domain-containing protein (c-di-GMP phosphodiesterase class II)
MKEQGSSGVFSPVLVTGKIGVPDDILLKTGALDDK